MGDQVHCTVAFGSAESAGVAHLETSTLEFRGGFHLTIPFPSITEATAAEGVLSVTFPDGVAAFSLGPKAPRWLEAIRNPKPVIDKLGVKPGMRVLLVDVDDDAFRAEVGGRAHVVGARAEGCDLIFLGAPRRASLRRISTLRRRLKPAGALWVLRPKASPEVSEMEVLEAGRAAGLVDTKVVAFSATLTAEKFVIPVASRAG